MLTRSIGTSARVSKGVRGGKSTVSSVKCFLNVLKYYFKGLIERSKRGY